MAYFPQKSTMIGVKGTVVTRAKIEIIVISMHYALRWVIASLLYPLMSVKRCNSVPGKAKTPARSLYYLVR